MPKIVDHDVRREEYVDALWRVVSRDGAGGISVRSVAAEAGVSPSNVVHYLPSRSEMLGEAMRRLVAGAIGEAVRVDRRKMGLEGATEMALAAIPRTPKRRKQSEIWLLLLAEQEVNPAARMILDELQGSVRNGIGRLIDWMAEAGLVSATRDRVTETGRLHALIDGLSLQTLINPSVTTPKEIELLVRAHLSELGQPAH